MCRGERTKSWNVALAKLLPLPPAHHSELCSLMLGLGLCKTHISFVTWLLLIKDARGRLEDGTREETFAPSSSCRISQNWPFAPGSTLPEPVSGIPSVVPVEPLPSHTSGFWFHGGSPSGPDAWCSLFRSTSQLQEIFLLRS